MRAIILNTDSVLNPGDTGIVLAQIAALRSEFPGLSLSLTSRTPRLDARFFGPRGVTVLPPLLPAPSLWPGFGSRIARSAGQLLAVAPKRRLWEAIRNSDLVVSCGGGCFYSNRRLAPGPTFAQNVLHVRLAQALGKPVLFFPQSFGPFRSTAARGAVLRMLDHPKTARILVREEISSAALRRLAPASVRDKMEICPDMAFLLEPDTARAADPRISRLPRPRLALTVREWDFPEAGTREEKRRARDGYLQAVRAAALHVVLKRRGSVVLVPHTRGPGAFEDDRIVSRRLWDRLAKDLPPDRKVFLDLPDETAPEDLLSLYAGMDVVLATRTHSAIFALLAGTPAVSVHYQPKGRGIMAMLGLAGRSLSIAGLGEAALIEALDAALDDDGESRRRVAARIAILREEISACLRTALKRAL